MLSLDRLNESVHAIEAWQLMGKEENNNFFPSLLFEIYIILVNFILFINLETAKQI